jgi:hypothetical protein
MERQINCGRGIFAMTLPPFDFLHAITKLIEVFFVVLFLSKYLVKEVLQTAEDIFDMVEHFRERQSARKRATKL